MSDDGAGSGVNFQDGSTIRASYIERVVGWFRHGTARIVGHREALGQGGAKIEDFRRNCGEDGRDLLEEKHLVAGTLLPCLADQELRQAVSIARQKICRSD